MSMLTASRLKAYRLRSRSRDGLVICSCLRRTVYVCFFSEKRRHGACADCGDLEVVEKFDGRLTYRLVCEDCRGKNMAILRFWAEKSIDRLFASSHLQ